MMDPHAAIKLTLDEMGAMVDEFIVAHGKRAAEIEARRPTSKQFRGTTVWRNGRCWTSTN